MQGELEDSRKSCHFPDKHPRDRIACAEVVERRSFVSGQKLWLSTWEDVVKVMIAALVGYGIVLT